MTGPGSPPGAGPDRDGIHLRLLWPQWQGAGTSSVRELAPEFPFDVARRGYAVGSAVLAAVLPPHDGPTAAGEAATPGRSSPATGTSSRPRATSAHRKPSWRTRTCGSSSTSASRWPS